MSRQIIEFGGLPVGIAVLQNNRLRFIAVKYHVIELDNQHFDNVGALKAAIRDHLSSRHVMAA